MFIFLVYINFHVQGVLTFNTPASKERERARCEGTPPRLRPGRGPSGRRASGDLGGGHADVRRVGRQRDRAHHGRHRTVARDLVGNRRRHRLGLGRVDRGRPLGRPHLARVRGVDLRGLRRRRHRVVRGRVGHLEGRRVVVRRVVLPADHREVGRARRHRREVLPRAHHRRVGRRHQEGRRGRGVDLHRSRHREDVRGGRVEVAGRRRLGDQGLLADRRSVGRGHPGEHRQDRQNQHRSLHLWTSVRCACGRSSGDRSSGPDVASGRGCVGRLASLCRDGTTFFLRGQFPFFFLPNSSLDLGKCKEGAGIAAGW